MYIYYTSGIVVVSYLKYSILLYRTDIEHSA